MGQTGGIVTNIINNITTIAGATMRMPGIIFNMMTPATVANTTSETSGIDSTNAFGSVTIPANFLQNGTLLSIRGQGYINTNAVLPSLTVKLYYGATVLSTSGAVLFLSQIVTPKLFEYTAQIALTSSGASASARVSQVMWINDITNSSLGGAPGSATIDTTTANALDIKFTWSGLSANNSVTMNGLTIEVWR